MAKSVRQQRVKAVDDLRDMADSLEQAAELFEDALGDLDRLAPAGGGYKPGRNKTYEELERSSKVYGLLLPGHVRAIADAHLGETEQHDNETCPICQEKRGPEKGWLTTMYRKMLKKSVREMLDEWEIQDVLTEVEVERIREQEREWLREHGRLAS